MRRSDAEAEFMGGFTAAAKQDAAEFRRLDARIADLESALREMHRSIPGGTICDPQEIADVLRDIATRADVSIDDS